MLISKVCTKCNTEKNISEFYKSSKGKYGLHSECKDCSKIRANKSYINNKSKYIENAKNWHNSNIDKARESRKKSYYKYIDKEKKYVSSYHKLHPDKNRAAVRKHRELHPEVSMRWRENNKELVRQYARNRRAKIKNAEGFITIKEWEDLLDKYNHTCLRCGQTNVVLTLDHIVPISDGGANSIDNVQPLCKSCNSSKGTQTIDYRV